MTQKYYLGEENDRNVKRHELFEKLIRLAFGDREVVLTGHHFVFELDGDLKTLNEIPSADTLIFDHDIMRKVFGPRYVDVLQQLVAVPVDGGLRDDLLESYLAAHTQAKEYAARALSLSESIQAH